MLRDRFPEMSRECDRLAVDRTDHIACLQPTTLARLAGIHRVEARVCVRIHANLAELDVALPRRHLGRNLARQRLTISYQVDGNFSIRTSADRDRERLPGVDRSTGNRDNAIAGPDIAALGG